MDYIHEKNILDKIQKNYHGLANLINDFYKNVYMPMRDKVDNIDFKKDESFNNFAEITNNYYNELSMFESTNKITSQSKFKSSFYEELSCYLFSKLPRIISKEFEIYSNKKICVGLRLDFNDKLIQETKNVDFCIGKTIKIKINDSTIKVIKPIIAVEVKTYTDATMFGEIKNTSGLLINSFPHSHVYLLMGYNQIGDDHIFSVKYSSISQIYALRSGENSPMLAEAFKEYYNEISNSLESYGIDNTKQKVGALIKR